MTAAVPGGLRVEVKVDPAAALAALAVVVVAASEVADPAGAISTRPSSNK
jgi:hypothetical protein